MSEDQVTTTIHGHGDIGCVAHLTIDRPTKLNALSMDQCLRMVDAFEALRGQPGLRAVVLIGAGDEAFLGGADVSELATLSPATARRYISSVHDICTSIRNCPVPVVARINGFCSGAGMEIAAACDIRVAARRAVFAMPGVQMGLPSVVEAELLSSLVGQGRARWLVLTGQPIDANTADRWGFVEVLCDDDALDAMVNQTVETIVAAAPLAVRAQKVLVNQRQQRSPSEAIRAGIDGFEAAYETDEPGRYLKAFLISKLAFLFIELQKKLKDELEKRIEPWKRDFWLDDEIDCDTRLWVEELWAEQTSEFSQYFSGSSIPVDTHGVISKIRKLTEKDRCNLIEDVAASIAQESSDKYNNIQCCTRFIAFMYAIGEIDELRVWFEKYSISQEDASDAEFLLFAVWRMDFKGVRFLLEYGAGSDFPGRCEGGTPYVTPVGLALMSCEIAMVRELLAAGFDLPVLFPMEYCRKADGYLFEIAGGDGECLVSAYLNCINCEEGLKLYAPFTDEDPHQNNILHYLANSGTESLSRIIEEPLLKEHRGSVLLERANSSRQTPIHMAIEHCNWSFLKDLAVFNPDLGRPEFEDLDELIYDLEPPDALISMLIDLGADLKETAGSRSSRK
jgi:enoyl-CoA hydratase